MTDAVAADTIGRKLFILVVVLVVLVTGWTGVWFWLRGEVAHRMDDQLAKLASRGVSITCPDRTIGGWPFRMDIDCDQPTFTQVDRLTSATVKHLRVTALVYQPTQIIVELDGPLSARGPNGESVTATWTELQSSLALSLSMPIKPDRVALVVDGLAAEATKPGGQSVKLTAAHAELHGRPAADAAAGSTDIDVALALTAATVSVADRAVGPEGADINVDSVVRGLPLAAAGSGSMLSLWAGNGGRLDLRGAKLSIGGFAINGVGTLTLADTGLLMGQVKLIATGLASLMSPAASTIKGRAELLGLATAFTIFGRPASDGGVSGRSLDLTIDEGRVKIGPTGFGRVPPLF